ncbi:UNVERIFIED_CONTAM: hypothetical protein FKN15_049628 [Acipenser sinensis]
MAFRKFLPLFDRVLVESFAAETVTKGGYHAVGEVPGQSAAGYRAGSGTRKQDKGDLQPMKSAVVGNGGIFTDSYCNICNAQLISESQRVAHYESKKHANKVRLFYMLHPEDGGPPSKRLRPDNPTEPGTSLEAQKSSSILSPMTLHYSAACDREQMNLSQQSPSRPVRARYNRNSVPWTGWFDSSFQGQSRVGHPKRGRSHNTRSQRLTAVGDVSVIDWRRRDCTRYQRGHD